LAAQEAARGARGDELMETGFGVDLRNLSVNFGDFVAVRDASVAIESGEFFSFLGPSGCGKTTILRTVSGFLEPSAGEIRIGGRDMSGIGPNLRPTALIFQNLALFPLMRVWENIAFALEVKGRPVAERRRRADELLSLIALGDQGDKFIHELSGGQKQRVAIARALAAEPRVLLLDEPLSALDLKLRQHMRTELRTIQQQVGLTFIYITHDQGEALTMSDRVAVMCNGVIEQVGTGREVYDDPATAFVASFVGENNAFAGAVTSVSEKFAVVATAFGELRARIASAARGGLRAGDQAMVFIRPESLSIAEAPDGDNRLTATISNEEFEGQSYHVYLEGPNGAPLKMSLVNAGQSRSHSIGSELTLAYDPNVAVALPAGELAGDG
jgi:spermidine/putrescine transport system ATP-binding protein